MMDYVELWDDYSIQFNETLEAGFGGDWNQLDQEEERSLVFGNCWRMDITVDLNNFSAIGGIPDTGMRCAG